MGNSEFICFLGTLDDEDPGETNLTVSLAVAPVIMHLMP